jgi:hypothetical protein
MDWALARDYAARELAEETRVTEAEWLPVTDSEPMLGDKGVRHAIPWHGNGWVDRSRRCVLRCLRLMRRGSLLIGSTSSSDSAE